jgi:hypothetical protein
MLTQELSTIHFPGLKIDDLPLLSSNHGRCTAGVLRDMPGVCSISTHGDKHTPTRTP